MGLDRPKVGIVGGTGRMGSWFARLLEDLGLEVMRSSRSTRLRPKEMVSMCDVIVISVPITDTENVIREIAPLVPKEGLLVDLTSIKTLPLSVMLKCSSSQVVGLHPLFGPNHEHGAAQGPMSIAVCPGRGEEGLRWTLGILKASGLRPIMLNPLLHDHLMGLIQGAHHFAMLVLATCIMDSNYRLEDILAYSTYVFRQSIDRIRFMLGQPLDLFASLLMDNPFSSQFIESYTKTCEQLADIINTKQRKAFEELFLSLRKYFTEEEGNHEGDLGQGRSLAEGAGDSRPRGRGRCGDRTR